ncbi:polysaccharide pyruvyl transferase family protein [Marinobacter salinisoli]|uniref:Polysaccharide pyruvyl transferase family protein n=1 Tax=Marinobacter salinisoli TaxID=2769486 RepID=A0ABX7MQJ0_9GAMM|nr:polysaccharide pyruvyl transferase family protein [Marinobacter salinisoli]QSP93680.1 polysaccharide pyruvyl transferase family protein [Marinobacter salinisoli]
MPKILMLSDITGLGPDYHVGDEAMAEVAIERLGVMVGKDNLILGCTSPERIPATYGVRSFAFYHIPDAKFRKMLWTQPLSYLKSIFTNIYQVLRCDKVVVCGGGNMTSVWPGVLEARLRLLRVANFFGRDIVLVSQTIGPYEEHHRRRVDQILGNAKWIGVRDLNFSHTQISAPVNFALDDACFLEHHHSDYSRAISEKQKHFACISMRKFGGMNDADVLHAAKAIEQVVRKAGVNTVFIPHHAPRGTEGDIKLGNNVSHLWPEDQFHLVDPIPLASELKALTADSQFVVSMRYHQLIFALSIGIPAVGIYVDQYTQAKLTGAFEAIGLEPMVTSVKEIDENLQALVDKALEARDKFEAAAQRIQSKERHTSLRPYYLLKDEDETRRIDQPERVGEAKGL